MGGDRKKGREMRGKCRRGWPDEDESEGCDNVRDAKSQTSVNLGSEVAFEPSQLNCLI